MFKANTDAITFLAPISTSGPKFCAEGKNSKCWFINPPRDLAFYNLNCDIYEEVDLRLERVGGRH